MMRVFARARELFALSKGRPQWARGVRTALALTVPILAGDLTHQPAFAYAALGGWLGSLADKGGSYRNRAISMGASAVLGGLCMYAGTIAAEHVWVAVFAMLIIGIAGGLGRVYGDEGASVGLFFSVAFAVAVGTPVATPGGAVLRGVMWFVGVVWAMVIALLFWPIHPFCPARRMVAEVYRAMAHFAQSLESVAQGTGDNAADDARVRTRALHADVRLALEGSRETLADIRRPKAGRSPRGEQLLVLTEGAEQIFGTLIAIDAELEAAHESGANAGDAFASAFGSVARTLDLLANAVDDTVEARRYNSAGTVAQNAIEIHFDSPDVHLRAAATLLARAASDMQVLVDTAGRIDARASSVMPDAQPSSLLARAPGTPLAWLAPLRDAFSLQLAPMRHALRMGVAAAIAVGLSFALDITRGYWATITVLIVLQPYSGATMRKTLQRVTGSIAGGVLAAALAVALDSKLAIAAAIFPLTIVSVAMMSLNYGIFVLFLTPAFVLLAEPHPGDWRLAGLRIVNTTMGGIIAIGAAKLLWPARESTTYAHQLAELLRELRGYLLTVTGPGDAQPPAWRRAASERRRQFGITATNAEAMLQRLITEDRPSSQVVESAMSLLTYGRRMASTLSALTESRAGTHIAPPFDVSEMIAVRLDALAASLDEPGAALGVSRNTEELPAMDITVDVRTVTPRPGVQSLEGAQLDRLRAQVAVMERAVARYRAA